MNDLSDQRRRILDYLQRRGLITGWAFNAQVNAVAFDFTADGERLGELLEKLFEPKSQEWQQFTKNDVAELVAFFLNGRAPAECLHPIHFN
jgi:hypothetical protein